MKRFPIALFLPQKPAMVMTSHYGEILFYLTNGNDVLGPSEQPVIMGSWERLESYAHDIIEVKTFMISIFNQSFGSNLFVNY